MGPDTLVLERLQCRKLLVCLPGGSEELLLADGFRQVRLSVRTGTLRAGPVRLRYALEGLQMLGARLLTLRRFLALLSRGSIGRALAAPEQRGRRWADALHAWDLRQAGSTHRQIAANLFGDAASGHDWRGQSDYLRLRVQRLLRLSDRMVSGGYADLLRQRRAP